MATHNARLAFARGCKLALVLGPVVGVAIWAALHFLQARSAPHDSRRASAHQKSPDLLPMERAPLIVEDSGFETVMKTFALPIADRRSLQSIRASYEGAAQRGIRTLEKRLAQRGLPDDLYAKDMLRLAQLHLYDGEYA
ncbi:MAG TPA: hypothetical protein VFA18_14295, partial [Gemmataceae bacterium]|nr:hypothetical protein [Gemmataceae bacterium]